MGFVQYFVGVLLLFSALVHASPTRTRRSSENCMPCPAGKYQKTCTECEICSPGSYTTENNHETSCLKCFRDCSPRDHLRIVANCTSTSDLRCICEPGFTCKKKVPFSDNCKKCEKTPNRTEARPTSIPGKDKPMPSPTSFGYTKRCLPPKCGRPLVSPAPTFSEQDNTNSQLVVILSVVVLGCVAVFVLVCVNWPRDETCFRQTIKKLCHQEGQDTPPKFKEPTHQFPRNSFSAKQQLSSPSAANLGPVHVHNPGTVIFSLLSHFTSQVEPNYPGREAAKTANKEEDERDCPVFHPTSSPSIHFSEEERSGEIENIFFPLQEQGKDCHVSKEESL